jgi:hypothetical protein
MIFIKSLAEVTGKKKSKTFKLNLSLFLISPGIKMETKMEGMKKEKK